MMKYLGLAFTKDECRLMASVHPVQDRPWLDLDGLRGMLADAGYESWPLHDEALTMLIERYNTSAADFEVVLGECRDASFTLEAAADAMQAWVDVVPAYGGKALDPEAIYMALGEAGVTFGIDQAAALAACEAREATRVVIATGLPAQNGENARFELLVADARDRAPQVDENGLIDFRELGAIPTVSAEQPLMRRIPATNGTHGRNIRGELLEAVPGRADPFAENLIGAHVAIDDPNLLRAVFGGQPVRCGNGVTVEQVLHVRNVNIATGNISFEGTVHIEGEVLPGMKVHATGDIIVGDVVDGAELEAGGDIRVSGGIIAKSHVRAGGSVAARFVENAQVFAGGTIAIDDAALQSDLQANNQILVGVKSPQRGRLAGGSARAMLLIQTPILGSPTGGVTSLLLGVNPVLEGRYQDLLKSIEKHREEEENLEKLVKHLTKQGDKSGILERAKASWQQSIKAWAKLLPQRDDLEKELALIAGARVEVGANVSGAVDITFGKRILRVRKSYETGAFWMDGERIVFSDLVGNVIHPD